MNPENFEPLNILLVEDNKDNQLLMKLCLKKTPHQCDIAENGEEAVDKFIRGSYDMVLMDIKMPVMDGITATKKIREWEKKEGRSAIPIIALTANSTDETRARCLEAGSSAFITKPINIKEFLTTLQRFNKD